MIPLRYIIIIIAIICLLHYNIVKSERVQRAHINLVDIKFKPGDIILTRTKYPWTQKYLLGNEFTHAGIIVKYNNQIKILHHGRSLGQRKNKYFGCHLDDPNDYIINGNKYGHSIYLPLNRETSIDITDDDIAEFNQLKHRFFLTSYFTPNNGYIHCAEFIMMVYEQNNIVETTRSPKFISPQHILEKSGFIFLDDYDFDEPKEIVVV